MSYVTVCRLQPNHSDVYGYAINTEIYVETRRFQQQDKRAKLRNSHQKQ